MKKILIVLVLLVCSIGCGIALPGSTTIYIVRHAEKDISDPKNQDPELSAEGKLRAADLAEKLKNEKLDAVFSTKYKRTGQTGAEVAKNNGINIQEYDGHNFKAISDLIKTKYKNRRILIVGHSNTVLELVEAFGATRPLPALTDEDYDFFFILKIDNMGKAALNVEQYGKQHRSSVLK
ncbi:Histidine phosphatase superfamily (branch 1) [Daejeonella rubra]|uniref:Histidine phosphatase superfamily (Branch 1) n=1 Tax=Daejeonella rubra TaxID=990371 RepID=A0A1G9RN25_9SPHI|nr:histidine phosphatase family protein [Daejeonella rubra]SDM24327.1 Histidine phosphatase superfamily (branch 1) [Daejeonella rubra]